MLSYKKENGGNEKLMGWEGGITTKAKLQGLEPTYLRSFHSDFINSRETISVSIFNSKEPFQYFPISKMKERNYIYRMKEFHPNLEIFSFSL